MSIKQAIEALVNEQRDLTEDEAEGAMAEVFAGEASPAQLAAFLVALRLKGETVDEVVGMARVMREHSLKVEVEGPLVDTCGTGGDGKGTFNVSTAAAFVAAGAGARVAKHGNRAMSSDCGSADVLEALGAKIDLTPEQVARCIEETGFGFMFAQAFHPAMKHAGPTRKEIGVRTVFNILGPLTNPAGAQAQVLGVARPELAPLMASALQRLGSQHALVVHGADGSDELILDGDNVVFELKDGKVDDYTISATDVGVNEALAAQLRGGNAEQNAASFLAVMAGRGGPLRDAVFFNAAAALVAADLAPDLREGVKLARESVASGEAKRRLDAFVALSRSFAQP